MQSIQLYLGHKNIQHTARYTELSPQRFKIFGKTERAFWKESQNGQLSGKEKIHGDM